MRAIGAARRGALHRAIPTAALGALLVALPAGAARPVAGVSPPALNGMSGLVGVPSAAVLPDGHVRLGASWIDEEWAYQGRGEMDNEIYYVTFGFLPRVEVSVRATHLPELTLLSTGNAIVVDRLASGRLLLRRGGRGPAVAVGIDDVRGTRLFHSLYAVATERVRVGPGALELTVGYGSDALVADVHVLDGVFGGVAVRPVPWAAAQLDFDTEKWNSGVALTAFGRWTVQVVLLHLDTPSGGLAWTHRF